MDSVKTRLKEQVKALRTEAIMEAANKLLAEKGYESMTMDEVAERVGMSKASLYKFFPSKEDLAAAAMVSVMRRAQAFIATLPRDGAPLDNLRAVVRWTMELKLAGEMPSLPSQNSKLRAALLGNRSYMDGLIEVSDALGAWIEAAQEQGAINAKIPAIAILYTVYARACDPVLEFLKMGGQHSDEQIIELVLSTCFDGLNARPV